MKTVKVWFSHTAHFYSVAVNAITGPILERLYVRDGVYYAATEEQYNALASHRL